ncbi:hypothetical protein BJY04DRAFT_228237 [Aspergillus karnatakaensis]|uniref:SDR family NAD(P)-dependent oxidoreductase n=1 Tax=Aspergillus karnatakaensis TaxID=1810916 RepID=UPI003CCCCFCA
MTTPKSLTNKTAIITGASRGIGAGIAHHLASLGANILITYNSSPTAAEAVLSSLKSTHNVSALSLQASATDPASPSRIVAAAVEKWGTIDIIINNAGARSDYEISALTAEVWEEQVTTNLRFPVFLVKEAIPYFGPAPRIVNVSSSYAVDGHAGSLAYVAAKGGLESVTRSLARELGQRCHATVNCVRPGPVNTELWGRSVGEMDAEAEREWEGIIRGTPAGRRVGEVKDVAGVVGFLVSEESGWVTGQVVNVSGGLFFE